MTQCRDDISAPLTDVHVGYPVRGPYTYRIPEGMVLAPGVRVLVDFAGRTTAGFVIKVHADPPPDRNLKPVLSVIDEAPLFDERLMELSAYVADHYLCCEGEALSMALPSGRKPSKRYKNPYVRQERPVVTLNEEQREVYERINELHAGGVLQHLIFGVTGSGKTEIYIELAKKAAESGRSVIYLVPEISLSAQIFSRLYDVFGDELLVYHSHLTPNQRLHNWMRFYTGRAKVAVGTRSAVFLQAPDLGMIIVDEEHDGSYKEHSAPRYNARRIAWHRSVKEKALLVMGSATPSIDTLYSAERGAMKLHLLKKRFGDSRLPDIEVVRLDSKQQRDVLSATLKLHSRRALDGGRQIIFLLNRRGFSPLLMCRDCGAVEECPHCSISMNCHRGDLMLCHYCGYKRAAPSVCGKCGSASLVKLGTGTQRAETMLEEIFRGARIFRLDQDTSRRKGTGHDLVEMMKRGDIDILLGTQMVAKGFDFQRVSLVGVILADIGLNLPDFRASERVFSLLMQVAGRSGRGSTPGKVVIQTLNDDHYLYGYLKKHDYYGFYRHEISMRRIMYYPPFTRLTRLLVRGKNEARVIETIEMLGSMLRDGIKESEAEVTLLGPSQAPLGRIAGNYRHHLVLKSAHSGDARRLVRDAVGRLVLKEVYLEIDMDPYDML